MKKQLGVFLIILALVFSCAFDAIYDPEEQLSTGEGYSESIPEQTTDQQIQTENQDYSVPEDGSQEYSEQPAGDGTQDQTQQENPEQSTDGNAQDQGQQQDQTSPDQTDGTDQNYDQPEQVEDTPVPEYQGINSDQLDVLLSLYTEMTETGKSLSGWFTDYEPCNWRGVTCEEGQVTGLAFENAGFFTVFPTSVLYLHDLRSLVFTDTLMRGPLPDYLFSELSKLEKLELRGNYLTGEIPALPAAYSPLQKLIICDNLNDENDSRKTQLLWLPEYADVAFFQLNDYDYPDIDHEPGLDGNIPENWSALGSLYKIDLSGNQLTGNVPDAFANLYSLTELDLSNNGDLFGISDWVYDVLSSAAQNYPSIVLDGIQAPVPEEVPVIDPEPPAVDVPGDWEPGQENNPEDPYQQDPGFDAGQDQNQENINTDGQDGMGTGENDPQIQPDVPAYIEPTQIPPEEIPYAAPTEVPYIPPTEIPYTAPTDVPYIPPTEIPYIVPTEIPYAAPTEVPYIPPTEIPYVAPTDIPYAVPTEVPYIPPTEVPYIAPTQVPPTAVPYVAPTQVPPTAVSYVAPTQVPPTEVPYVAPTQIPPTAQPIIIVVTATPVPQWYTATPPSYYPTQQPYIYPTATPYYPPYYSYPTATPYTYYNPQWVYPTATSAYSYDYSYVPQYQSPTQIPTILPAQDQAALLGFTYTLEAMTENNIPMTWRYTGMQEYSIVYLDASGNLYPAFAMEWKPASEVCNSSVCNASVSVPQDLLQQGRFSLQLRVRDATGKIYMSDPVDMEVSLPPQPTPTPVPEQPKSLLGGFFAWLFGPIIRLFGGGK